MDFNISPFIWRISITVSTEVFETYGGSSTLPSAVMRELAFPQNVILREVALVEKRYPLKSSPRTFGHMVTPQAFAVNDKPHKRGSSKG